MLRRFFTTGVAITLAAAAGTAAADHGRDRYDDRYRQYDRYDSGDRYQPRDYDRRDRYDDRDDLAWARVVHVAPIRQRVRVSEPVRDCWQETEYRPDGPLSARHIGGTLVGSVIGGALGNQVGRGDGRKVARAAGALLGAAIAYNVSKEHQAWDGDYRRDARHVERCGVSYRDDWVERIEGYDVTYEYDGQRHTTWMPYDPGDRIRVRVDVTPVSG